MDVSKKALHKIHSRREFIENTKSKIRKSEASYKNYQDKKEHLYDTKSPGAVKRVHDTLTKPYEVQYHVTRTTDDNGKTVYKQGFKIAEAAHHAHQRGVLHKMDDLRRNNLKSDVKGLKVVPHVIAHTRPARAIGSAAHKIAETSAGSAVVNAAHKAADTNLSNSDAELCFQFVTSLGLLLVIRDVILSKDIGCKGLLDVMNTNGRKIRLMRIGRPYKHMHVRVTFCIMIRRIPAKILRSNVHLTSDIVAMRAQKRYPLACLIVAKSFGIFSRQREYQAPDISLVLVHLLRDLREDNGVTIVRKQTV